MLIDELDRAPLRNQIVVQAVRSGRKIPDRLLKDMPPEVHVSQQLYVDCFWDVCSDRTQGSRIRYTAVAAWCTQHRLSSSLSEDVHFVVKKLDLAYIEWAQKKNAKESKAAQAKSKRKNLKP